MELVSSPNKRVAAQIERKRSKIEYLWGGDTTINQPLTSEELTQLLLDGDGIYWSVVFDKENNITEIVPYKDRTVVKNLFMLAQKQREHDDLFYDFNSRL